MGEGAAGVGEEDAAMGQEDAKVGEGVTTGQGGSRRYARREGREALKPRGACERMGSNDVGSGARCGGALRR